MGHLKGVSVIICTYNGSKRLSITLSHLVNQMTNIPWEIILVDNASTDGTFEFARKWWATNGNAITSIQFLSQPIPGKQYAQEMGYEAAQFEYLLVCDDDNWLCDNYVQLSYEIMESDEKIGGLGGWCEAEFETENPSWFEKYAKYFAVSKQGEKSGDISDKKGCLYGAGMVLRKSHWNELNESGFSPLLTCRKGETLSSGGDTEYSYALRLAGYKMWYDERLYFKHFMTQGRLNLGYFEKLRIAMSQSNQIVLAYKDELRGNPMTFRFYFRRLFSIVYRGVLRATLNLISNDMHKSLEARIYFRELKMNLFQFTNWYKARKDIKEWVRGRYA